MPRSGSPPTGPPGGAVDFRALVENSRDLISVHDPAGICLYASPAAGDLLGLSPSDLVGRSGFDPVHPEDAARVARCHRAAIQDRTLASTAYRLRRRDGSWVWVETTCHAVTDAQGRVTELQCATRDISDRKAVEQRLAQAEEQFRLTVDGAPIGMALVSPDGPLLRVNAALCDLFGYPADQLLTKSVQELTHPDDFAADLEQLTRLLDGQVPGYRLEKRFLRADGNVIWGLLCVGLVHAADGSPRHLVAQVHDITDDKTEHTRLQHLAERDPLTGLYNRRRFREEATAQLARAHRHGETAAVLLLDVDSLKDVNDTHGHHAGDQLLRAVAEVLHRQTRDTDTVARLGGDEFAVLLPTGSPDTADAGHAAQRVRDLIRSALQHSSLAAAPGVSPTASIGVALLDRTAADVDQVLIAADRDMYRDKTNRREQP